ncbi:MAG: hypothetical protein KY463_16030, partial [Actinobacteria bacterium]|nr:hypothetical protein [Actinomycetota bacterium]
MRPSRHAPAVAQRAGRPDLVPMQARATQRSADPLVRQEAAALHSRERVARWNVERGRANRAQGRPPGPEGSLAKLAASGIARASAAAHTRLAGPAAMLCGSLSISDGQTTPA